MSALVPGVPIHQHWSPSKVLLSYLIAVTGSYCTIQLMEQWRRVEGRAKTKMLALSAITLGGCGTWCTHFTGMAALYLALEDGTILVVDFEVGLTIFSLVVPIVGVFVGLKVASKDPFFIEVEKSRRKELLVASIRNVHMFAAANKDRVRRQIKIVALFTRPWRIVIGSAFAALGVLGMHYLGMLAQRTNADMALHGRIVAASVVVAFVAANAAFWILFRALTFLPNNDALRLASAHLMGVAVCGTHYSGMGAATYTVSNENYAATARFVVSGNEAALCASHGALLLCFWLLSSSVGRTTRKREVTVTAVPAHLYHESVGRTTRKREVTVTAVPAHSYHESVGRTGPPTIASSVVDDAPSHHHHVTTINGIHKPLHAARWLKHHGTHKSASSTVNSVRKVYIIADAPEQTLDES